MLCKGIAVNCTVDISKDNFLRKGLRTSETNTCHAGEVKNVNHFRLTGCLKRGPQSTMQVRITIHKHIGKTQTFITNARQG